ncbi:peroxin 22-like protein [Colletotrichum sojae]|uniref:Peroxin 22-like protein n=1 Tax=Colletotrichum sojae TaxID=2175907 RepID=A0A8H6J5M4_9PEZI|nr:peroxin 22-like protein [Colletotrichum sojae]
MSWNDQHSRRRGVWSHWVPLAVTVTVATVGLAAWVWSQRKDEDETPESDQLAGLDYDNADYGDNPAYGTSRGPKPPPSNVGTETYGTTDITQDAPPETWGARMSGALRRTPSPQQFLESAGKTVTAGVAAAGAAAGRALAAIREEDKNAYADHETWSEEADARKERGPVSREPGKRRKTVVIVVSADSHGDDFDEDGFHEHASILSHIPRYTDFSSIKLFVLIYAPGLKETASSEPTSNLPPPSLSSSFSNIEHHQAQTPGDESSKSPLMHASSATPAFNAIQSQALALVEKETMVMPFTTPNGHTHILRHLQPEIIYLQESLAGENGSFVSNLQTWLRHDIILVVGADNGHGGLADSESEAEKPEKEEKWWQRADRVGRGRGVVVVDGMRVHDDWARRVQGRQ